MTHNHFPKAWSVPTRVGPPPPGRWRHLLGRPTATRGAHPAGEALAALGTRVHSRGVLRVVVFLDVDGQKLLLPEALAAADAGERLLPGVGSGVRGQVALLGGGRGDARLSSSQGGPAARHYSWYPPPSSPFPRRCVHHEETPQRSRSQHGRLLGWERGLGVYETESQPVPAIRLQSSHDGSPAGPTGPVGGGGPGKRASFSRRNARVSAAHVCSELLTFAMTCVYTQQPERADSNI